MLGVYPESEGYPNIKYRLEDLAKTEHLSLKIIHEPIWPDTISNQKKANTLTFLWRFVRAHVSALVRYVQQGHKNNVYIPYPAVFISVLLSWLPKRLQPKRLILDAFISLYDTTLIDRGFLSQQHPLAKLLFSLERRAYHHSSLVLVDTEQNALYLSELFQLPRDRFVAIPLTINEHGLPLSDYVLAQPPQKFQILFVGTLIPLHGIEIILQAIQMLANDARLEFKLICNGQLTPLINCYMPEKVVNFTWIREWQTQSQLLQAIESADICLGIFGTTPKTQRVCPLKVYSYAAGGRAIITAETEWMRVHTSISNNPPFHLIQLGSAEALAAAIRELIANPVEIERLARSARQFYTQTLSNQQALTQFLHWLE